MGIVWGSVRRLKSHSTSVWKEGWVIVYPDKREAALEPEIVLSRNILMIQVCEKKVVGLWSPSTIKN